MNNPFLTKKDSLVEAVQSAMQDGELRRQAEALVNEEFGVYSRKAVVREQLAAYDARLEEAYKCMKEEDKKDEKPKSGYSKEKDKHKAAYSKMREKMVGKGKDYETTSKIVSGMNEAKKLADKDYDKDGKIESPKDEVWGSRFRAAKMAGKMEEEQIDEISKKTLGSYIKKAASKKPYTSIHGAAYDAASGDPKARKTIQKREKGIGRATDRLTKEETQIDEISRHTLMSYRNKAAKQVMDIKKKGWSTEKDRDTVQKREIGHSLAGDKMRVRVAASYNKGYSPEDLAKHGGRGGAAPKNKMDEAQIDEVSLRVAKRALNRATHGFDPSKDHPKRGAIKDRISRKFGDKEARKADVDSGLTSYRYHRKNMKEEQIDEAAYSAKSARAGKDIGKPGKMFSKIAKKAGERYGSEERGKKVAGAILKRIRAKHMKEENLEELSQFGSAFAAARKSGQTQFSFGGKSYSTAMKGQSSTPAPKPATSSVPTPTPRPTMASDLPTIDKGPAPGPASTPQSAIAAAAAKKTASPMPPSRPANLGKPEPGAEASKFVRSQMNESVQVGENKYRIV